MMDGRGLIKNQWDCFVFCCSHAKPRPFTKNHGWMHAVPPYKLIPYYWQNRSLHLKETVDLLFGALLRNTAEKA